MPAFLAAAGPRRDCLMYWIFPPAEYSRRRSSVASVLPSLTTIISKSAKSCLNRLSSDCSRSVCRLCVGMITEKVIESLPGKAKYAPHPDAERTGPDALQGTCKPELCTISIGKQGYHAVYLVKVRIIA